jgi:hypothetical protein
MNVTYFEPLARAWHRMVRMLFQPFRIEAWLTLGLAAFLAELGRWPGGGNGGSRTGIKAERGPDGMLQDAAQRIYEFVQQPWVIAAAGMLIAAVVVGGVLVTWLSARGRFVLLANVASGRPTFMEPWRQTARLGNSLFFFQLALGLLMAGLVLAMLLGPLAVTVTGVLREGVFKAPALAAMLLPLVFLVPAVLAVAIVNAITVHFVMPVMLRHGLGVLDAWRRLMPLLGANLGHFIAALLLMFVLATAVGIGVVVVGFATCCVGFLLLGAPYVGDVLMLPVHLTFRAFGPEFLAQYGSEWDVFEAGAPDPRGPAA